MGAGNSINRKRFGTILNYLSLIFIVLIFEYGKTEQWDIILLITEIAVLSIFLVSFVLIYVRSGLWEFIHKPLKKLDEREIALTSKSLRYSYTVFTVILLLVLLILSIFEVSLSVVLVAALIIFAHILPASVLVWTENRIVAQNN